MTVNTTSGYVGPTVTTTRISGGTPTTPNFGGTTANINDNNTGTSITTSALGDLGAATVAQRIVARIDYGSNKAITKIEAVGLSCSINTVSGGAFWYSTDGTTWTQLGSGSLSITTSAVTYSATGSVAARYIAYAATAANFAANTVTLQDLNGYQPLANNMTLVTTAQTADASVSNGRVLMEIDNIGAGVLNTDLTAEVTCAYRSATVTISIASPGVVTHTAHGLSANAPVTLATTGALPTGLAAGVTYFVKTVLDANTYTLSATAGGTVIATTGSQSGTHTLDFSIWTAATLTAVGLGQSGRTVVETADTACTAGTSFAARIKTLNNKSINIYKTTMVVH